MGTFGKGEAPSDESKWSQGMLDEFEKEYWILLGKGQKNELNDVDARRRDYLYDQFGEKERRKREIPTRVIKPRG
ncbi:MAG: hypothetical protein G01um10148_582 [Parcubacteria group bacterium Gr01-1014_8]|nr:MAG: hypothetical protein G01um10148_582 [Parcubacteria group bacterium Gr01-1014_8]